MVIRIWAPHAVCWFSTVAFSSKAKEVTRRLGFQLVAKQLHVISLATLIVFLNLCCLHLPELIQQRLSWGIKQKQRCILQASSSGCSGHFGEDSTSLASATQVKQILSAAAGWLVRVRAGMFAEALCFKYFSNSAVIHCLSGCCSFYCNLDSSLTAWNVLAHSIAVTCKEASHDWEEIALRWFLPLFPLSLCFSHCNWL